ncbi:hypothetical protein HanOQP8_Chr01g0005231 [Helianthus annuus]|nr:hypothetical protein HanOQP8_Chr01g0005231 [Helianthus annuus]
MKTKTSFKTITLDDDEDDLAIDFSTVGGLLANLNAHLHGGRTPRDHLVTGPTSPLSFGGGNTKVFEDIHMPDPCLSRRPSLVLRLGSGDVGDMDSARALEKYIPDWSLVNKDRIVDALSAKMALFHLGTPAEHAHYRKMSGPELRNALMLNQAQSNSLVVETYKRWIESESSRYRLKGQVLEAKEVNKSSQASVVAAHEARDKALQDFETLKLKFADLEKKLAGAEKRHAAELKEMKTSYDQLLADHHRLLNDNDEIERARDRAIESHKATIDEAKGMLTRTDGEMVEVYAQVSEFMLTKQWFLTEGVAWVVRLVHESPEL